MAALRYHGAHTVLCGMFYNEIFNEIMLFGANA